MPRNSRENRRLLFGRGLFGYLDLPLLTDEFTDFRGVFMFD